MSDLLTDLDLKTERATEPPKRWRNWWRFSIPVRGLDRDYDQGDHPGPIVFPSRDIAETVARHKLEHGKLTWSDGHKTPFSAYIEYLGAFPDGEAP